MGKFIANEQKQDILRWHTYIIYSKESNFLEDFLNTSRLFIEILKTKDIAALYYIELGNDNLKVSFKASAQNNDQIRIEWKCFDSTNVSRGSISKISYNLGFPGSNDGKNPDDFFFIEELSELTIKVLTEEVIVEDLVLLYSLYLHFSWIKMRSIICDEHISTVILKGYCWFNTDDVDVPTKEKLFGLYNENQTLIMDLFYTIMSNDLTQLERLPVWVKTWFEMCIEKLYNNRNLYFNQEHLNEICFYLIPGLINKHLGISKETRLIQLYYINRAVTNDSLSTNLKVST